MPGFYLSSEVNLGSSMGFVTTTVHDVSAMPTWSRFDKSVSAAIRTKKVFSDI
jgi:hypothetical protein